MKNVIKIFIAGLCLTTLPIAASAQGKGNPGRNAEQGDERRDQDRNKNDRDDNTHRRSSPVFTTHDRTIITDYFRNRNSNLPPGLAKRNGNLPPGLQKQLQRNGTLPPGLQKRLEPLSGDLERRLPPLPVDYRRGTIGQDVVVIDSRTQRIIDIVHAVTGR